MGRWSSALGVSGVVEADALRALVDGNDPTTGSPLLVGLRERTVKAFDLTFSAPKAASLLWTFGSEPVADVVMGVHREAVATALGFLEDRAALARIQVDGVRRHVPTDGWVVAGFVHRTSRAGDPQLHTHCLVPNVVRREDGRCVAIAARPCSCGPARPGRSIRPSCNVCSASASAWSGSPTGTTLARSPGSPRRCCGSSRSGPSRSRPSSKRPAAAWRAEAVEVGLEVDSGLEARVCWRDPDPHGAGFDEIASRLIDEEDGLCAHAAKFAEHDVVEHVAGLAAGRLSTVEITEIAERFLRSDLVVRLTPNAAAAASGWEPARWTTVAQRNIENETLLVLDRLAARAVTPIPETIVAARLDESGFLGIDQRQAITTLCGSGASVGTVLSPAGYGKTAMAHAAAGCATVDGRHVTAVATTAKAVAELEAAGLPARTIVRFRYDLAEGPLPAGTVVVLDETSQTSTRDAHAVLAAVDACPGGQLWVLGDPQQAPSVKAGGIAAEIASRADANTIPSARLTVNRRQVDADDRRALHILRCGGANESQQLRRDHGWEHTAATPEDTRRVMADAVTADVLRSGAESMTALVVSHAQAEDLADRIRRRLTDALNVTGTSIVGPGWTADRTYQAGDRMLLHTRYGDRCSELVNGTVGTVDAVDDHGVLFRPDRGEPVRLSPAFISGSRADGSPNVSHAWARTVDGAQGGTWEHVHLLGTAALDAYRGYTAQSRSVHPTHTWNIATLPIVDFGGRLAHDPDPEQQVAVALSRIPDTTMAAVNDPWTLDTELRQLIAAHREILDRQPPDRQRELDQAVRQLAAARTALTAAQAAIDDARHNLNELGVLASLTRHGRAERRVLDDRLHNRQVAAIEVAGPVATPEARVERLHREQAAHDRHQREHDWRRDATHNATERLTQHWTDVALACVRADQTLAYGVEPLRIGRRHIARQLAKLTTADG